MPAEQNRKIGKACQIWFHRRLAYWATSEISSFTLICSLFSRWLLLIFQKYIKKITLLFFVPLCFWKDSLKNCTLMQLQIQPLLSVKIWDISVIWILINCLPINILVREFCGHWGQSIISILAEILTYLWDLYLCSNKHDLRKTMACGSNSTWLLKCCHTWSPRIAEGCATNIIFNSVNSPLHISNK